MTAPSTDTLQDPETGSEQSRFWRVQRNSRPTQSTDEKRGMRWSLVDAAVIVLFLAIAYMVTSNLWVSPTTLTPRPNGTDQTFFEWMLLHAVRIFTHGENPFLTPSLNAPIGVNVMANTGLLGLAIPLAPLTALIGPAPVFVLITMLGLAGTATSWYYVMSRHFVGQRFGAFLGAIVCGFGPGIVTHANGHPNLVSQFLLPLILWRALALRRSSRPVRDGLIFGVLVTYQAFLNEELLFLTALGATVFVGVYAAFRPKEARAAARPMVKGLAVGAGLSAVLLAVPLWYQFYGPGHFNGLPAWMQDSYRLPVSSFLHTPTLSLWGSPDINALLSTGTEQNSFLGVALLLAALGSAILLWRRSAAARSLAIVVVIFAWASFGNRVVWSTVARKPVPVHLFSIWKFVNHLPIFDSVLPSRLALVAMPAVGLLIALGAAEMWHVVAGGWEKLRPFQVSAGAVAIVALVTAVVTIVPKPVQAAPRSPIPQFFMSGDWKPYVPAGYTVLPADPSDSIASMRWAVQSKLDFGVPGGYFLGPDQDNRGQFGPQFRQTMVLLWNVAKGTWRLDSDIDGRRSVAQEDLAYWNTAIIVMPLNTENADELKQTITTLVGSSGKQVDDVWLWDVRAIADGS